MNDIIKDKVFTAFNEYKNKTYVSLKGVALYNWNDKLSKIEEIEYIDVLDPLDVSLRINNLLKLGSNWYEGQGKQLNQNLLITFGDLFNSYFDSKLPLPAIFPTVDGNIQLEWKRVNKNITMNIELSTLKTVFFYYNDLDDSDEYEEEIGLENNDKWDSINNLIETYI